MSVAHNTQSTKVFNVLFNKPNNVSLIMDVISGMATMAMAIPTISFGHRSGHFWP